MAKQSPLTPQADDFARWYQDIINKAELADNGPVRGTMIIRPYAFGIWERIQEELDKRIKEAGAENAYFPLLIPESFLAKEAEHVEGFSPELAVVTHGGGKELEEPAVIRPTSETIINHYFAKWVQSHRDLPLLINQWCNVVRWEMRPRTFLRTTEFLWQEGHTAHATEDDARQYAIRILREVYEDTMVNVLAIPVVVGRKSDDERFAGATTTWTCEGLMRDGKALQMGTSHELGQNFAKAFGTQFLTSDGSRQHVWQTSWGVSTRTLGGLIMAHGDDDGLRVPPAIAPIQVVVMVAREGEGVGEAALGVTTELENAGVRVRLDERTDQSFGRRATGWELRGVPVRIEIGPRELAEGLVSVVRRDTQEKRPEKLTSLVKTVPSLLDDIQRSLLDEATRRRDENIVGVQTVDEAIEAAATGFATVPFALLDDVAMQRLRDASVTIRCLQKDDGSLFAGGGTKDVTAFVARSY